MSTPSSSSDPEQHDPQKKENKNTDNLIDYFKTHARETTAYILLVLGILLLFFNPLIGGILVGIITGIYFGDEILDYILNWKKRSQNQGIARHLISAGIALAFFISAPAIFLGAAIAIGIKQLFVGPTP